MWEFIGVGLTLVSIGIALMILSYTVSSHGEKFKEKHRGEAQTIQNRILRSMHGEHILDAISHLNYLAGKHEKLAEVKRKLGEKLSHNDELIVGLRDDFREAMEEYDLSTDEKKDIREYMEEIVKKVSDYESQRILFRDAWSKEIDAGENYLRLGVFIAILGIIICILQMEFDPLVNELLILVVICFLLFVGMFIGVIYNLSSIYRKNQKDFIKLVDTEIYDIEPAEESEL